jgi:hypothetical protein
MEEGCMRVPKGRKLLRNLHVHERIILKLQVRGKEVLTDSMAQDMKPGVGPCNHGNKFILPGSQRALLHVIS